MIDEAKRRERVAAQRGEVIYQALSEALTDVCRQGCVLSNNRSRVIRIGAALDCLGGFLAMTAAYREMQAHVPPRPDGEPNPFHPSEVEAAWDGVGEWRW